MEQEDIGKAVDMFVKRLDGRVFAMSGILLGYDDTHFRVRTNGHEEEILRNDVQRIVFK